MAKPENVLTDDLWHVIEPLLPFNSLYEFL